MKGKPTRKEKRRAVKSVVRLPDLEVAKSAVLPNLSCPDAQRGYVMPSTNSWTGTDSIPSWPRLGPDHRTLPRLHPEDFSGRERQDRNRADTLNPNLRPHLQGQRSLEPRTMLPAKTEHFRVFALIALPISALLQSEGVRWAHVRGPPGGDECCRERAGGEDQ